MLLFPLHNFSLKHSCIVAEMNGFFGNVIMTVVDKHACSSPVVIKLGAFCVAVDVVVDRFNFFIVFLCWDVHNKVRVSVVRGRYTVLILFAQGNDIDDLIKDFSVASKLPLVLTIVIWIQVPFALSLKVPFSASSSITLSITQFPG